MGDLLFMGMLVLIVLFVGLYFWAMAARSQKHTEIMQTLEPSGKMSDEDCEYFNIFYGKRLPVGTPLYSLRGEVDCIVTKTKYGETRESTIAGIKIAQRCDQDLLQKGTDLSIYSSDFSLFFEELKPLNKRLKDKSISPEEKAQVEKAIAELEDEHVNVDVEFTFLNPNNKNSPAFVTGIDLWNINPKRIKDVPQKKTISSEPVHDEEELVSFDIQ